MSHSSSRTHQTVPAYTAPHTVQLFLPHRLLSSQFRRPSSYDYNKPVSGGSHQAMGNVMEEGSSSARRGCFDNSLHQVPVQNNSNGSSPSISASTFARTQRQQPPSAVSSSPNGTSNTGRATAAPAFVRSPFFACNETSPDALPLASLRSAQTQSRLPPNTVARKVPQKDTVIRTPAAQSSQRVTKPKLKDKKPCHQLSRPNRTLASPTTTWKMPKEASQGFELSLSTMSLPAGSKRIATKKKEKLSVNTSVRLSRESTLRRDDKISSFEVTEDASEETETSTAMQATISRGQIRTRKHTHPPRPQFEYEMTPELDNIRHALGQEDWTVYLILTEQRELDEISEKEFEVQERRMFSVSDTRIRKKMRKMVVKQIVGLRSEE